MATATDPLAANGYSPLRGALLALLLQGPSYGYELANRLERQLGPEWRIVRTSLYRMLKGMRVEGLLSADEPELAESKIVYRVTDRAEPALISWMESLPSFSDGQLQLQARMIVARYKDLPRLLAAVNNYERRLVGMHSELGPVTVEAGSLLGVMMRLVRAASRHRIEAELSWLDEARRTVEAFVVLQEFQR